jgi:hypothetical protein
MISVNCEAPLGLESGAIPDSDITASSAYDFGIVGPQHGRSVHFQICHTRYKYFVCESNISSSRIPQCPFWYSGIEELEE